ncbi:IclR family transcriptional regulator [Mycolicibacterium aichiense]|uniref:Transcriptional regulator n=1 Tax=Mycolicibacterium aichiense TaxID=1799 RepID=A0AAD1HT65_9MYCO|nr:IclR family transcriptional regulator [Mycolicibacterium aichiense]MCV7016978.1 IclR family transcriptional regulator [Mycolicibacterium aichiense]BBX10595.1 transcriptional regulator [Mycolicibacterium aichiense]STZ25747.1 regulatory proteins IclR [Mycolicibacterium aichiense]
MVGGGRPSSTRDDGIQVLRRAAAALDEIATAPGRLRLVDLHSRLGLAKSTTRRLLVGLVEVGFAAVDDDGRIVLGDRLLGLVNADAAHITSAFRSTLERVAEATGETVDLSVYRGGQMLFIDQIESPHRLRAVSAIGGRFTLCDTANGKAVLALLGDDDVEQVLAALEQGHADRVRAEIRTIRTDRVAFDRDEHTDGISAAGIAGRAAGGNIVAISVPAPTVRFNANSGRIVAALHEALKSPAWTG